MSGGGPGQGIWPAGHAAPFGSICGGRPCQSCICRTTSDPSRSRSRELRRSHSRKSCVMDCFDASAASNASLARASALCTSAFKSAIFPRLRRCREVSHVESALQVVNALLLRFRVRLPDPALQFDELRLQIADRGLRRLRARK